MKKFLSVLSVLFFGLFLDFSSVVLAVETPPAEQPKFGNYLPEDVPNVFDPEVRAQYPPVGVANLRGNPDFPVLILQNTAGGQPQVILLGLDARNGKESWSLASDPIILIVLFADSETILGAHVDAGFADSGNPSRVFRKLDNSLDLPNLKGLRELGKGTPMTFM